VFAARRERRKAQALAAVAAGAIEVVIFELGAQRYALPAADVEELLRAATIVAVPDAPTIVEGAIDVRGRVVPVLDVRRRFGLAPKPLEPSDHLVLATTPARTVAIRVDRAVDLVRIDAGQIEDPSGVTPGAGHLAGIARLPDGLVLIHDVREFLSAAESADLEAALQERSS
jgi:purine-binding chemotaxis protein CheW